MADYLRGILKSHACSIRLKVRNRGKRRREEFMSYEFYKVLHIIAAFALLLALGGLTLHIMNGGTRQYPHRRFIMIMHGIAMLISLVAGFGMLARLGLTSTMPGWALAKLAIWFLLGVIPAVIYRKTQMAMTLWFVILALAGGAAWLAINKPF